MKLKEYLELCKKEYYAGNPIISDSQYDNLEDICSEDLTVGTNKGRCRHWYRMYSLQKYYTDEEIKLNLAKYYETPKLDGASLAIRYVDKYIDSIVTRGDGKYGEDVSHLICSDIVKKLNIPAYIRHVGPLQITGELVAPKTISNARNYAAGALNLKTVEDFMEKNVVFFAYDIQEVEFENYSSNLGYLERIGFNTVHNMITSEYPQDGTVFRLQDNVHYKDLGYTNKHPRGAFAMKERSQGIKTIILDVIWDTGKSGKVTPVALLEPIEIDGAKVSRATLNNPGFIEALGVQIGDSVMVERAGGIIPRIIKKAE